MKLEQGDAVQQTTSNRNGDSKCMLRLIVLNFDRADHALQPVQLGVDPSTPRAFHGADAVRLAEPGAGAEAPQPEEQVAAIPWPVSQARHVR